MLKMLSPKRNTTYHSNVGGKEVTIEGATFEDIGLRERMPTEAIHLREDQFKPCERCTVYAGVWTDDVDLYTKHKMRCT